MTALPVPTHPILGCVAEIGAALDQVADAQAVFLSTVEKAAALRELAVLESRVAALRLRVMAVSGDVAEEAGARDVAAWYASRTRTEPEVARAHQRLAEALDRDRPQVGEAVGAGRCSVAQARVIVRSLEELPERVDPEIIGMPRPRWSGVPGSSRRARCAGSGGGSWTWSPRRSPRPRTPAGWRPRNATRG